MTKKRIGIPYTGEDIGGSHLSSLLLVGALDKTQFEPVILLHHEGPVADFLRRRSLTFLIEPLTSSTTWEGSSIRRLLASFLSIFPIIRLIRKHRLDLIHVQDHKTFQLWVWGAMIARCPLIFHWRAPYRKTWTTRFMTMAASRILVVSNYIRDQFPKGLRRRSTLIYNPFDTEQPAPDRDKARTALRTALGLEHDAVVLAWIGNCNRRKHPEKFVDVVQSLVDARRSSTIKGVLLGNPGNLSHDPGWIAKRDQGARHLIDLGFHDPVTPVLAGCDALVITAAEEPFGRTIVEAMLCGVPVVAPLEGGHVEIIKHGETGYLVPFGDIPAYVESIGQLLDHPERGKGVAEQARLNVVQTLSVTKHANAVMAVYASILGSPSKTEPWIARESAL